MNYKRLWNEKVKDKKHGLFDPEILEQQIEALKVTNIYIRFIINFERKCFN